MYTRIYIYSRVYLHLWQCAKLFWRMAMDAHCSRPSNTERLLLAVWLPMPRRIGDTPVSERGMGPQVVAMFF